MSHVWIESGPASRRTLVLCLILGLSVGVHRCVVGLRPASAEGADRLASAPDQAGAVALPAPTGVPAPRRPEATPPDLPAAPAARPSEPRVNPYARRLWVMDPFRSPNVLRLVEPEVPAPATLKPLLSEAETRDVLARTTVEQATLASGATHVSITMAAAEPAPVAPTAPPVTAGAPAPSRSARTVRAAPTAPRAQFPPSIFAFAGHDLTREEGRRWTLALAFEGRGD